MFSTNLFQPSKQSDAQLNQAHVPLSVVVTVTTVDLSIDLTRFDCAHLAMGAGNFGGLGRLEQLIVRSGKANSESIAV